MTFKITLANQATEFSCEEGQTVLDAALQKGVLISYGCKSGQCGSCRGKLISGKIEYPDGQPDGISQLEVDNHQVLFCKAVAQSDITIEVKSIQQVESPQVKKLPTRVISTSYLSEHVMQLMLQLPAIEDFKYKAGQWINFILRDGRKRAFSIANAPNDRHELELQIRHAQGGVFTDFVFNQLKPGALLQIEGPHGSFYYQQDDKPILLVAGGTGFAPIKGMLEQLFEQGVQQPIHLFWGVREQQDLYQQELIESWIEQYGIQYTSVLSEPKELAQWSGKTGFVHQAVMQSYPQLAGYCVYMAGPPQMITSCRESFVAAGLDENNLYYDSFEYSADAQSAMKQKEA